MITGSALKRLASHRFRIVSPREDGSHPLDGGFPLIVADKSLNPTCYTWRIPSVNDPVMDMLLGEVMALGYLRLELDTDGEYTEARYLFDIVQAMEYGGAGENQRLGFFATLERFNVCALCRPAQLPALYGRLKRMTDADLNALYLAALRGETLHDFFAEADLDTP